MQSPSIYQVGTFPFTFTMSNTKRPIRPVLMRSFLTALPLTTFTSCVNAYMYSIEALPSSLCQVLRTSFPMCLWRKCEVMVDFLMVITRCPLWQMLRGRCWTHQAAWGDCRGSPGGEVSGRRSTHHTCSWWLVFLPALAATGGADGPWIRGKTVQYLYRQILYRCISNKEVLNCSEAQFFSDIW